MQRTVFVPATGRFVDIPDPAKIDHAVRDALVLHKGGMQEHIAWFHVTAQHRLNGLEQEIGVRCYHEALPARVAA
jgi:hypothetical protein